MPERALVVFSDRVSPKAKKKLNNGRKMLEIAGLLSVLLAPRKVHGRIKKLVRTSAFVGCEGRNE